MNLRQRLQKQFDTWGEGAFTLFFLAFAAFCLVMAFLPGHLLLKVAVAIWLIL